MPVSRRRAGIACVLSTVVPADSVLDGGSALACCPAWGLVVSLVGHLIPFSELGIRQ